MQVSESQNLKLLKSHLVENTLAHRLVTEYGIADGKNVDAALDSVLAARMAEVRNAIDNATNKLG